MGLSNRERRAAKQRQRDRRRGVTSRPADADLGRGLPAETLERLLRRAGADLADGREEALTELRHLLAEHLARRRPEILAACDTVLAGLDPTPGPGLGAALGGERPASHWAEAEGVTTEEAAVATVRVLAGRG
ncbi:hypothetical protein [Actinomycetospora termitidis]|uniref:Uncharacterized protein n=1 Tax=Actinomycetospora termitidis TaxID=3053470 RepID=A0ABT7M2T5_9PSEU|nr:hypothetical protein [Actinomycetospora sp. Odt1-22]MDL5154966.1 hypothetical protein [Actinomycetospora sp. Odt1-22]